MKSIRKSLFALFATVAAAAILAGPARSADPGVTKGKVILGSFLPLAGRSSGSSKMTLTILSRLPPS
jgi:hypothetical protein